MEILRKISLVKYYTKGFGFLVVGAGGGGNLEYFLYANVGIIGFKCLI